MGRRSGLPVLAGFVVEGAASVPHMRLGAETLPSRGSGGARLVVSAEPIPFSEELVAAGERTGWNLVARSSTSLESTGTWAGAFSSLVGVSPGELPKAVASCWASAFSTTALERQLASSIQPGTIAMSVLVQPALDPNCGGTARIDDRGTVTVHGVKGHPAPLLQGWESGATAIRSNRWSGDELIELAGVPALETIAAAMAKASRIGADACEWAIAGDELTILQLGVTSPRRPMAQETPDVPPHPGLVRLVRALAAAPGPLGEALVLPWALAGLPRHDVVPRREEGALGRARELCRRLTAQVWGLPPGEAADAAEAVLAGARSAHPGPALDRLTELHLPDPAGVAELLGLLAGLRLELSERGMVPGPESGWQLDPDQIEAALDGDGIAGLPERVGLGRWEPLIAAVVCSSGEPAVGAAASDGLGAGRMAAIEKPVDSHLFSPRAVLSMAHPVPALAPLLWDAAGVVTASGSPAAHFFDSARSLGVPAVCGVELDTSRDLLVAVNGFAGTVHSLDLEEVADA